MTSRFAAGAVLLLITFGAPAIADVTWVPEIFPRYDTASQPDAIDFSRAGFQESWMSRAGWMREIIALAEPPDGDATGIINGELDRLGKAGGGTLRLGEGRWEIQHNHLRFPHDNVRLEGAGIDKTVLHTTGTTMSGSVTFHLGISSSGTYMGSQSYPDAWPKQMRPEFTDYLTSDAEANSPRIYVLNPTLMPGMDVIITGTTTEAYITEHNMTGVWSTQMDYPMALRRIERLLPDGYVLDMPIRYPIKVRDKARVFPATRLVKNLSLANFTLEIERNPATDFENGPGAAMTAQATAIMAVNVENALIENIRVPVLPSRGVEIAYSRFVTVRDVQILESQNQNSWWNGYQFFVWGCDNLIQRCVGRHGRRSFTLLMPMANGNVFTRCISIQPRYVSDYHQHLSQVNLVELFSGTADHFECIFRPYGTPLTHGISGTENIFWNMESDQDPVVWSAQSGLGYVVGTRGPGKVKLDPAMGHAAPPPDYVEGEGRAEKMWPQSLYEYQLAARHGFPRAVDWVLLAD